MLQPLTLPSLEAIPEDIDDQLRYFIHYAPELVTEQWLCDLIKNSGHLTTPEYLRWRIVTLLWLATRFDVEKAWPYLMWFNMGQPTVADHLNEIIGDGVEEMQCHVQLATWIAEATDERLVKFFSTYQNIPPAYKVAPLLRRLVQQANSKATGVWLADFCRNAADSPSPLMRRWHLLAAVWYATCFNPTAGLVYLKAKSQGQTRLSAADNEQLTEAAKEIKAFPQVIQWIAACPNPAVKMMLQEVGHPDLDALVATIFDNPPNYDHLTGLTARAIADAETFARNRRFLEQAGIDPKKAKVLDLACGPLAPQTLLLNSAGYTVTGVDLSIPPDYLPLSGFRQRFKKGKYVKAWQAATTLYYEALGHQVDNLKLKWKKVTIKLADLTRLEFPPGNFEGVICANHLQHAADVNGLLAEVARVLKSGGLFLADLSPYPGLSGGFQALDTTPPWDHLRPQLDPSDPTLVLNQWGEAQFRAAVEKYFVIEQWLTEQDALALAQLTPELRAELTGYSDEELTRKQIVIVARKP